MARILCVTFDGVQTLDVTGPAEVFAGAARVLDRAAYRVSVLSSGGGVRTTSSGVRIHTDDLVKPRRTDIVVVAGGGDSAVRAAMADTQLVDWLRRAHRTVARMTSVCSGAFLLAHAGILDGKRATTHWAGCALLSRSFPNVRVDGDAIFVEDGKVWTSAGVTTGIDMALAIVERDHNRQVADAIAARLVLYVRRPGFQSQFSEALVAQQDAADPLGPAIAWVRKNLARATPDRMAAKAGMSLRTLHRRCVHLTGNTPARLIDKLRVEHGRTLIVTTDLPLKTLAARAGFPSTPCLNRAFERQLGMTPKAYRLLHTRAP